ncbi:predicted protein [Chaetomium globosum CBS 148.51]|uniref:Uncharacterized protein n=1 Tax=Chaetomium globosum (strain ATCC 6205 / CBS 148.51 / DSM 1962 / NBRC 6347 / NRRL 1970) TaxID=306901 RepID=Q2H0K8_CHAGB|nr:uncharacterized protein CHGG_04688 [Chaetomium globosum CBS 148.51]EAQ88069.1 predicted protein [Chaetomium globosum CBS 148.51]
MASGSTALVGPSGGAIADECRASKVDEGGSSNRIDQTLPSWDFGRGGPRVAVRSHQSSLDRRYLSSNCMFRLFWNSSAAPAPRPQTGQAAAPKHAGDRNAVFINRGAEDQSRIGCSLGLVDAAGRRSQEGVLLPPAGVELYVPLRCMLSRAIDRGERSTRLGRRRTKPPPRHFTRSTHAHGRPSHVDQRYISDDLMRSKGARAWTLSRQNTGTAALGPSSCSTSRRDAKAGAYRAVNLRFRPPRGGLGSL